MDPRMVAKRPHQTGASVTQHRENRLSEISLGFRSGALDRLETRDVPELQCQIIKHDLWVIFVGKYEKEDSFCRSAVLFTNWFQYYNWYLQNMVIIVYSDDPSFNLRRLALDPVDLFAASLSDDEG